MLICQVYHQNTADNINQTDATCEIQSEDKNICDAFQLSMQS